MLQQDEPDDFVIATGEAHTVQEFVELAFERVGLDWRRHVEIDPRYFRPAEVSSLCGDPSKARETLGWTARTSFEDLVALMVDGDIRLLEDELAGRLVRVDRERVTDQLPSGAEPLHGTAEALLDVDLGLVADRPTSEGDVGLGLTYIAFPWRRVDRLRLDADQAATISRIRFTLVGSRPPPTFITRPRACSGASPARRLASITSSMYVKSRDCSPSPWSS